LKSGENFIVIYDDISMDFWKIRFRNKWSAWGHNWIKDIIKYFWETFNRIKVWVWYDEKYEVSDWVLSKFKEEELIDIENIVFKEVYNLLKSEI
jgi:PTH1 family peptidyl-tRNA hydrolase